MAAGPAPLANLRRQIEELRRQKVRLEEGVTGTAARTRRVTAARPAREVAPVSGVTSEPSAAPEAVSQARPPAGGLKAQLRARLKAGSALAARRLGVPLRGSNKQLVRRPLPNEAAGPRRKRLRLAAGAVVSSEGGVTVVKEQIMSSDEDEEPHGPGVAQSRGSWPGAIAPKVEPEPRRGAANGLGKRPLAKRVRLLRPTAGRQPDTRGRNLVGSLLGHLAAAKKQLGVETSRKKGSPGLKIVAEYLADRRRGKEPKGRDSGKKSQEKEMVQLQRRLEAHYGLMKHFIRTRAEPTIFYLPVKHTPKTKRFLEETKAAIQQKIVSLKSHLQTSKVGAGNGLDDFDEASSDGGGGSAGSAGSASQRVGASGPEEVASVSSSCDGSADDTEEEQESSVSESGPMSGRGRGRGRGRGTGRRPRK